MGIVMADKETDDTLEEDSSTFASKILSKSMPIKIAIGLLILLSLAGGAYFFFMPADEVTPEKAALDINGEIIPPISEAAGTEDGLANSETTTLTKEYTAEDVELLKMREEAVALKEENLQMKERLSKLESTQNPNIATTEPAVDTTTPEGDTTNPKAETTTPEDDTKISEAVAKPKPNPYTNLYSRDDTLVRRPQREPPPEPKWGDFDPLYRGR
jgi:hypothetical protein